MKCIASLFALFLLPYCGFSQEPNPAGFSYFEKYNKDLISSEMVQKHVFSIGTGVSQFTSLLTEPISLVEGNSVEQTLPYARLSLGYHYFFLKSKNLTFAKKSRNEASGFSIYANIYGTYIAADNYTQTLSAFDSFRDSSGLILPQTELRFTFTNPTLSYRGKLFNLYLLHEFGLSVLRGTPNAIKRPNDRQTSFLFNIVPLSIKLGTKPVFFKSVFNLGFDSRPLQLQKLRGSYGIEMQIYFYKAKDKKK